MSKTRPTKRARDETSVDANGGETSPNRLQGNESQKATIREKKGISYLIKSGFDQVQVVTEPSHEHLSDKFNRVVLNGKRVKFAYTLCCHNLYSQPLDSFDAELVNHHECTENMILTQSVLRGLIERRSNKVASVSEPGFEKVFPKFARVLFHGHRTNMAYTFCCKDVHWQPLDSFKADFVDQHKCQTTHTAQQNRTCQVRTSIRTVIGRSG